jgi:hypothetical protein
MRIGRAILFPAVLTLTVAGFSLAGAPAPAAAVHISSVHVVAEGAAPVRSGIYYQC